jgi:hypothetical protein
VEETFDRPGEFADLSPEYREKALKAGLIDMGDGKSAMAIDDDVIEACRGSREYVDEVLEKSRVLIRNIKDNGSNLEECWAAFMALSEGVEAVKKGSRVLLSYVLAKQVFDED